MNSKMFAIAAVATLAACTVNTPNNKSTSWGKAGVSQLDYQTDSVLCASLAEQAGTDNGAKTAGGVSGQNTSSRGDAGAQSGGGGSQGGGGDGAQSIGGGTYRDSAPPDLVSRAASQERAHQMQLKQARADAMHSCLVKRGYVEFSLTDEQRAHLASLKPGTKERSDYLYQIGTDPAVLKAAAANSPK